MKDIANKISSDQPSVPGGGTTIAINSLLGISLFKLTYTVSKKTWPQKLKNKFDIETYFKEAEDIYIKAMDEDVVAFTESMESKKIIKDIIEIPLKVALSSKNMHTLAIEIEQYIKKTVIADHQIAKENLITSMIGGINIIESNYNFFNENSAYIKQTKDKVKTIKEYLSKYRS